MTLTRKTRLPRKRTTPRTWRCPTCSERVAGTVKQHCAVRRGTLRSSMRTRADTLWAQTIKARGVCLRCGKTGPLDAAHIIGRARLVVRHDPENGLPLCRPCHRAFDTYAFDREAFIVSVLGVQHYLALRERATKLWNRTYPIVELTAALKAAKENAA